MKKEYILIIVFVVFSLTSILIISKAVTSSETKSNESEEKGGIADLFNKFFNIFKKKK